MIGLPLRRVTREVYDRVCAAGGPSVVAFVTGEERVVPKRLRKPATVSRSGTKLQTAKRKESRSRQAPSIFRLEYTPLAQDWNSGATMTDG